MTAPPTTPHWRQIHALGLPAGSVRALLALGVVGTVCGVLLRWPERALPEHLESLLFVVMGHYFAARGQGPTSDPAGGPGPLFLPRGSVRLLLVAALVTVGALVIQQGGLQAHRGLFTLVLVFGFLLGLVMTRVADWFQGRRPGHARWFEDLRAILGIVAVAALALYAFVGGLPGREAISVGPLGPEQLLAGLVGFYFGSRS